MIQESQAGKNLITRRDLLRDGALLLGSGLLAATIPSARPVEAKPVQPPVIQSMPLSDTLLSASAVSLAGVYGGEQLDAKLSVATAFVRSGVLVPEQSFYGQDCNTPCEGTCGNPFGSPTCEGVCPDRRRARVVLHGFYGLDGNGSGVWEPGETIYSPVKGGRKMEIQFWGCWIEGETRVRFEAPERNADGSWANGVGINLNTGQPYVDIYRNGPIEDWIKGKDRKTGQITDLAIIRFQFRRYKDDWSDILIDPKTKRLSAWEGCAFLCPVEEEPETAHYYIETSLSQDELKRRGMQYNPHMARPGGNPMPAIWTYQ